MMQAMQSFPPSRRGVLSYARLLCAALLLCCVGAGAEPAKRIVSLAPHLTELAFAAGAGERVVATVEYSDHPTAALTIPRIGDAFRVDLERLLAARPDIVLAWDTGTPKATVERIRTLQIPVATFTTHRLADVAQVLRRIGEVAGTGAQAEAAAAQFEGEIATLRERYRNKPVVSVFIQVDDQPLYTVNGRQIISEIVALCGGRNVFADLQELAPAIGIEAVIAANPQVILSTDDTVQDSVGQWRRWSHIEAVRSGNVFTLRSDDIARASPRLVAATRDVCRTLDTARDRLPRR